MDRDGVEIHPIDSMLGPHHLNEVFFDEVAVTADEILGELHQGWEVIRFVLAHERIGIARYARSERFLALLAEYLPADGRPGSEALHSAHARLTAKARTARLMNYRALTTDTPGLVSCARLETTLLDQEVAALALELLGEEGLYDDDLAPFEAWMEAAWRYARSATIASGTSEVQRLLVSRAMRMEEGR
jgi:alkylation response protein AidB-like acyl-CoA dehydrogenase